ncbi:hypothetical protein ACHAXS_012073 [Conticribra weissflogii]
MEIDNPPTTAATSSSNNTGNPTETDENIVKIHPLALIGISDHHTRVICGGSALPPDAPVVGLLFGYREASNGSDGATVVIVDAEEMEYPPNLSFACKSTGEGEIEGHDHRAAILQKIELHRKVFPRHVVVGWYRVQQTPSSPSAVSAMDLDSTPTEDDLRLTNTEVAQYCSKDMQNPLFVLMNSGADSSSLDRKQAADELDNQLPLSIYETLVAESPSGKASYFVNVNFELETYEPERIAMEKVLDSQPTAQWGTSSKDTFDAKALKAGGSGGNEATSLGAGKTSLFRYGKKSKKEESGTGSTSSSANVVHRPMRGPSNAEMQIESLESSIRSMNARINILLQYLRKVENEELPRDESLVRSVDGLLQQLPLVMGSLKEASVHYSPPSLAGTKPLEDLENEYNDTVLLSYLAAVSKTANALYVYSEKFRGTLESNTNQEMVRRAAF